MAEDEVHPHPLLIELVLENVFKNLSRSTLLTCRQVSSKWYHEASKYFRPLTAFARVDTSDSLYQLISTYVNCPEDGRPRRFHLTVDWAALGEYDLEVLLEVLGSNIKYVTIPPTCSADLVRIFETLLRHVAHLEELQFEGLMDMVPYSDQQVKSLDRIFSFICWRKKFGQEFRFLTNFKIDIRVDESSTFFTELFNLLPSVTSLNLIIMEVSLTSSTLNGLARALNIKREVSQNLKSLTVGNVSNDLLEAIENMGMKLEELCLINFFSDVTTEALERVLRAQAPYLRSLALGGVTSRAGSRITLTGLGSPFEIPNLTEFKLLGELVAANRSVDQLEVVHWQGLDWRLQMLKLERLELTNLRPVCFETVFGNHAQVLSEGLTSLVLKVSEEVPCAGNLRRLAKAFPGVTELEVVVDSAKSLDLVFQSWPKLKKLKLSIVGDIAEIDQVFTGVQFKKCLKHEPPERDVSGSEVFEDAGAFGEGGASKGQGILNLSELEDLTVEFRKAVVFGQRSPAGDGVLLSDVTGTLALLMMKQLTSVRINKSDMTLDIVNLLRTELSLETCAIKDRYERNIPPEC